VWARAALRGVRVMYGEKLWGTVQIDRNYGTNRHSLIKISLIPYVKLLKVKVRNGAPCSVAKGRRVMTNETTLKIL